MREARMRASSVGSGPCCSVYIIIIAASPPRLPLQNSSRLWPLNKIMLKKNQLRTRTPAELMQLATAQTDSSNLLLCLTALRDRNAPLLAARDALIDQLASHRTTIRKTAFDLNDGTKDRLRLKHKLVLDNHSRPTNEEIAALTELFSRLEHQVSLTSRNVKEVKEYAKSCEQQLATYRKTSNTQDYSTLDEQFVQLKLACEEETKARDELLREQERKRREYSLMAGSIEECRTEWEIVEERIRTAEREMVQLSSYYSERSNEDSQTINQLQQQAAKLEDELLRGQQLLNLNRSKQNLLEIQHAQHTTKLLAF